MAKGKKAKKTSDNTASDSSTAPLSETITVSDFFDCLKDTRRADDIAKHFDVDAI